MKSALSGLVKSALPRLKVGSQDADEQITEFPSLHLNHTAPKRDFTGIEDADFTGTKVPILQSFSYRKAFMNFTFHTLDIYKLAKSLAVTSYRLTKGFPDNEKYALISQINRAAVSVAANIVEGYSRSTAKDKRHFLNIAYGSLMELVCEFEIGRELGYISQEQLDDISSRAETLGIKISSFSKSVV